MLGMRDEWYRRDSGVPTIAGQVWLRTTAELHEDPAGGGDRAARQVSSQAPGWWLHTDLDVLDRQDFSACGAASDDTMPGGLSWPELAAIASSALHAGARGWSLAVYNADLDPDRRAAARIVSFIADVTSGRRQKNQLESGI
jgi:arginase